LAAESRAPLYLYDLPAITKTKLRLETIVELSRCPNIRGIKCSDEGAFIRQLIDALDGSFQVFVAQPDLIDILLRWGISSHLDGVYALAPAWVKAIGRHAVDGRWDEAARCQRRLTALRGLLIRYGVFPAFTVLMNARGMSGSFAPRPYRRLGGPERERLLTEPVVRELLSGSP
ncbi:MAG: dihydrodipicolinate synthase family protein, partial [Phycisphaerae bacterium]